MGGFNLAHVCWKFNTVERKQLNKFLECVEDNFLTQLVCELVREDALLDLLFVSREGMVSDVVVRGHLRHSYHEIKEFSALEQVRRRFSRTAILDLQRAAFGLSRNLADRAFGRQP